MILRRAANRNSSFGLLHASALRNSLVSCWLRAAAKIPQRAPFLSWGAACPCVKGASSCQRKAFRRFAPGSQDQDSSFTKNVLYQSMILHICYVYVRGMLGLGHQSIHLYHDCGFFCLSSSRDAMARLLVRRHKKILSTRQIQMFVLAVEYTVDKEP